jgi:hypothetical protein
MIAAASLLLVLVFSLLVTRVATIALIHTGLSKEVAKFQARSAFTGSGFTTSESERVVNHPVRRRIVLILMLLGNAGFITAMATLLLTFVGGRGVVELGPRLALIVGGVVMLWFAASSQWVDRRLSGLVEWALRRYTHLDVQDYTSVLHLTGDYRIVQLQVTPDDWLVDKTLAEAELSKEGILVLGVQRMNGSFIGAPRGDTRLLCEDTVYLYGRIEQIQALDERKQGWYGDAEHHMAKAAMHAQGEQAR